MKIRTDFVTNSSSSSFIISYKKDLEIPENQKGFIQKISSIDDINKITDLLFDYYDYNDLEISDDILKNKYHFTDEQLLILKAVKANKEDIIDKILDILKNNDGYIYFGIYDWDYDYKNYNQEPFTELRQKGIILYNE